MQEVIDVIEKRICISAKESCKYSPMTRVVSVSELNEIIDWVKEKFGIGISLSDTLDELKKDDGCMRSGDE